MKIYKYPVILATYLIILGLTGCNNKRNFSMLEISRADLLAQKRSSLEEGVEGVTRADKKEVFSKAFEHHVSLLEDPNNTNLTTEKVRLIRDDSVVDQAVADVVVKKLYPVNIEVTPNWMHLHDKAIADKWADKNVVLSYLDYANASLGGGAFSNGWTQEEQMVAFCTEFALLLAGEPFKKTQESLVDPANINFITRSTRDASKLSPRPKYLVNLRCSTGTPVGTFQPKVATLEFINNPPAINIIAAATQHLDKKKKGPYELLDLTDLFSNIYRAFELVKNYNSGKENVIFGGRIGGGVFNHSVLMSAAMQILAARIVGIENLVLTGQKSGAIANIYEKAIKKVDSFLDERDIINMKIEDVLSLFLDYVKDNNKWDRNSSYK